MSKEISKYDDVIDSRDIIARIEELQEELEPLEDTRVAATEHVNFAAFDVGYWSGKDCGDFGGFDGLIEWAFKEADGKEQMDTVFALETAVAEERDAIKALEVWEEENRAELNALIWLQAEAEASPDWNYGEGLIRDSYFKDYAQQLAEDCGLLENTNTWPGRCIDWEQAAEELKMDYFSVDFDGETYWIRS